MIAKVDQEYRQAITSLCDTVVRLTGLKNMAAVAHILNSTKLDPVPVVGGENETSETKE